MTLHGTEIDGRYKLPVNSAASGHSTPTNSFRSRAPDIGDASLIPALRKQNVEIDVRSPSSWTRLLGAVPLPMLLFLGFILVAWISRFMRGGKATSGSAMPMHPMDIGLGGLDVRLRVDGLSGLVQELAADVGQAA